MKRRLTTWASFLGLGQRGKDFDVGVAIAVGGGEEDEAPIVED